MRFQIIVFLAVIGVFGVGCTEKTTAPKTPPVKKKHVQAVKKKQVPPPPKKIALHPSADLVRNHASLLGNGKYQELEIALSKLRKVERLSLDGAPLFYRCVDDLASRIAYKPLFDAWCSSDSKSYLPYLYRGLFCISWAWDARGHGWSSSVTKDGWRLFKERLVLAKADLELARERNQKIPEIYLGLLIVARGMNDPEAANICFAEGESLAPCHYPLLWQRLQILCAKWHGSSSEMWRFARERATRKSQSPLVALLILEAHYEEASARRSSADYFSFLQVKKEIKTIHAEIDKAIPNCSRLYALRRKIYGSIKDLKNNRKWWIASARAGDERFQYLLGMDYLKGRTGQSGKSWFNTTKRATKSNVSEREQEGFKWILAAAKNGYVDAMVMASYYYYIGTGTQVDTKLAVSYAAKAIIAGHKDTCEFLCQFVLTGKVRRFDKAEVVAAFEMGARLGFTKAKVGLACSILQGWKRPRSLEMALRWFVIAAKEGDKYAKTMQARLERDLCASRWAKRPSSKVLRKIKSPIALFRRCIANKNWKLARQVAKYQLKNLKTRSTKSNGNAIRFWTICLAKTVGPK